MGSKVSLLIVDPDVRSLRVLEVSLRKAGFQVSTAQDGATARGLALELIPDLLVIETHLPDVSGFDLADQLRGEPRTARVALVFLSKTSGPEAKTRAIEAGADDFLSKPVLVREIVHRVRTLMDRRRATHPSGPGGHLSGALVNLGVIDILQVMEAGSKSGIVRLSSSLDRSGGYATPTSSKATLYFVGGRLVDAQLGGRVGTDALYRVLLWEDGDFEVELTPVERPDQIQTPTQALLLEGLRRVDEWTHLQDRLPQLSSYISVDHAELERRYEVLPRDIEALLETCDGTRTLIEVIDEAPLEETLGLELIARLYEQGVLLVPPEVDSEPPASLGEGAENSPSGLPSALGRAVIPSPQSASEIMVAAAAVGRNPSSSMLSRRHVVAHNVYEGADGLGKPVSAPELRIHRVRSVIRTVGPRTAPGADEASEESAPPGQEGGRAAHDAESLPRAPTDLPERSFLPHRTFFSEPPSGSREEQVGPSFF